MSQFAPQQYKTIRIQSLLDPSPIADWEKELNRQYNDGWKLHSLIPQVDENGTYCNVAIFERREQKGIPLTRAGN
ncbi:hypothetical protein KIH86_25840 [Paenibacillus sp. HN-1]|uniref:DUF4177 domain-containing protein n=1 Tax=Paenibacillus TaxID=44249 RepID=UPI001CA7DCF5|nr:MULTISPECIES: DUF4177 domain-containing protein [Paenibacillus]MBY9081013.1 hypothetical protein [Paenibacillus sp. CGMCC 1.18879]MBY9087615.1 hypothetical protein [Paenibacillus sinensis]